MRDGAERTTGGACLRFLVAFFGVAASILNATVGGGLFLLCAVTLHFLKRKAEVTRTLLPWFIGGKLFLYLLKEWVAS